MPHPVYYRRTPVLLMSHINPVYAFPSYLNSIPILSPPFYVFVFKVVSLLQGFPIRTQYASVRVPRVELCAVVYPEATAVGC